MAEAAPKFALFVVAVTGALVRLYGTNTDIGARRSSEAEIAAGADPIVWDEDAVTPITEAEYALYRKEYDRAIQHGSLRKVDAAAYQRWLELQDERSAKAEKARRADLKKAEKVEAAAKAAADAAEDEAALRQRLGGSPPKDAPTEGTEES